MLLHLTKVALNINNCGRCRSIRNGYKQFSSMSSNLSVQPTRDLAALKNHRKQLDICMANPLYNYTFCTCITFHQTGFYPSPVSNIYPTCIQSQVQSCPVPSINLPRQMQQICPNHLQMNPECGTNLPLYGIRLPHIRYKSASNLQTLVVCIVSCTNPSYNLPKIHYP